MIKRSDKLPRGSYFYVQVGHRFFAGYDHPHQEIKRTEVITPPSAIAGRFWSPRRNSNWRYNVYQRSKHGMKIPAYQKTTFKVTSTQEPTGQVEIKLVDCPKSAKQYRTKAQAEQVQEKLERYYKDLDIKVSIRLHEGDHT